MSNVSFTPRGNQYQKTSTGKKVGVTTGAIAGGVLFYSVAKSAIKDKSFLSRVADKYVSKYPNLSTEEFFKKCKRLPKVSLFAGAAIVGGVGLAIGAIVDKVRNNNRRAAADSASNK